jgi:hypothetical protein
MLQVGEAMMMQTRIPLRVVAILAGGLLGQSILAHEVTNPFVSVSIYTDTTEFKTGAAIPVNVVYRNISDQALSALELDQNSVIVVTTENGSPVKKTFHGKCITLDFDHAAQAGCPPYVSLGSSLSVDPKAELKESYVVNDLYVMNIPGQYRIFVRSEVPPQIGHGTTISNAITITVKG